MSDAALGVTVMWTADPEGRLTFASSNLAQVTGFPEEQFAGWGWKACIHPDDRIGHLTRHQSLLADPRPFTFDMRIVTAASSVVNVNVCGHPIYNVEGGRQ